MRITQVRAREWWTYAVVVVTGFVGSGYFLSSGFRTIVDDEDTEPPKKPRRRG